MAYDPTLRAHQEWLGYIQPVGLVVSPAALVAAGCVPDRNVSANQEVLRGLLSGDHADGWHASPQARLERLLRETGVPAGLLVNGDALRLVAVPKGESAGWLHFDVASLCEVAGRPLCSALLMLLAAERLFTLPTPFAFRPNGRGHGSSS
jgi:hypothetical protein